MLADIRLIYGLRRNNAIFSDKLISIMHLALPPVITIEIKGCTVGVTVRTIRVTVYTNKITVHTNRVTVHTIGVKVYTIRAT